MGDEHGRHPLQALQFGVQALRPSLIDGQAAQPDTSVHQFVYLARDIWGTPPDAVQRRHHQDVAVLNLGVHLPLGVAGRDACNSGDINAGVDVALRDTGCEQVAALGQGFMPGRSGS